MCYENLGSASLGWFSSLFDVGLEGSGGTVLDDSILSQRLDGPDRHLVAVVDAGWVAVAVNVRKEEPLELVELLKTDRGRLVHDPPGELPARRFGDASVVPIKPHARHEGVRVGIEFKEVNIE